MAQTKTFMIRGTSNYSSEHSIELELKVNSAKQAQERFIKKYSSILAGYWYFSVLDSTKHFNQVGAFEIGNESEEGINKTVKNQTELFNKTVNDSGLDLSGAIEKASSKSMSLSEIREAQQKMINKTVKGVPMLSCASGKVPAKYQYQDNDGELHYWHGFGRKPRWWNDPAMIELSRAS